MPAAVPTTNLVEVIGDHILDFDGGVTWNRPAPERAPDIRECLPRGNQNSIGPRGDRVAVSRLGGSDALEHGTLHAKVSSRKFSFRSSPSSSKLLLSEFALESYELRDVCSMHQKRSRLCCRNDRRDSGVGDLDHWCDKRSRHR